MDLLGGKVFLKDTEISTSPEWFEFITIHKKLLRLRMVVAKRDKKTDANRVLVTCIFFMRKGEDAYTLQQESFTLGKEKREVFFKWPVDGPLFFCEVKPYSPKFIGNVVRYVAIYANGG